MIDSSAPSPDRPANHREIAQQTAAGITDVVDLAKLQTLLTNAIQEGGANALAASMKAAISILTFVTRTLAEGEDRAVGELAQLAQIAIKDLLDVDVQVSAFSARGGKKVNTGSDTAIGAAILESLTRGDATMAPSDVAAKRFLTTILNFTLEGWVQATTVNTLSAVIPYVDAITQFGELDDMLAQSLGLGRLTRRVVTPLLNARVITPFQWQVNKEYRPELLSPGELARQVARGRMTREAALEEMARQGWSDERSEALLSNAARFFGVADAYLSWRMGLWSRDQAAQHLRDQGYTLEQADHALQLQSARDVAQFEESLAGAAVSAYADRRISRAEFSEVVRSSLHDPQTASRMIELGEARRMLSVHSLSAAEARRLARAEILSVSDYRRALEREGYDDFAVTALELELRTELQAERDLERARAEQAAEREREKAERDAEKRRREAELEEKRARAFPSLSEYRRLYVRGLLPIGAYGEALTREKIQPTEAAALIADAEAERAEYLEGLERRREAEAREADAAVPIGALEQAVLRDVISLADYARDLAGRGFDEAEIRILHGLLADKLDDQAAARDKRAEADRRAAAGGVSLATFERAVRLGIRSRADYAAYLAAIGTDAAAAALILELLDAEIERDAEAQRKRDEAAEAAANRGISLEQRARAVVRGVRPIDYYAAALTETTIPIADQQVLLDLLEVEALAAAEARARRDELAEQMGDAELSLSQVERAVRLGALSPSDLRDRAIRKGLSVEDAELLVQLVVADLPDVRRAQDREEQITGELEVKRISLPDEKQLVKRGIRTPDQYAAWLGEQGYGEDDVALLRQLLEEEIAADLAGLVKRITAKLEKADGAPAFDEFTAALLAGELDATQFRDALVSWGVGADEALVAGRLLLVIEP